MKIRVLHAAGTVNVGSRAPAKPLFYMALREGGGTAMNGRRPRSGCVSDRDPATGSDPEIIPGDHIPTGTTHRAPCSASTLVLLYRWSQDVVNPAEPQ
jgi:hypothetical protein